MEYSIDLLLFLITTALFLLWFYGTKNYGYWNEHRVFCHKPFLPFFGNIKFSYLFKSNRELINYLYNSLSGKPYGGIYIFTRPALIVRDPELIKKILVTDFNHFVSRGFHTNDSTDPLSKNLIHVNGKHWKQVRPKLQTAFTFSKLKNMVAHMDSFAKDTVKQIRIGNVKTAQRDTTTDPDGDRTFEAINVSNRYMIDVICSTVFGIRSDAIDFNLKSEFLNVGTEIFDGYHFLLHAFVGYLCPGLHKLFNMTVACEKVTNFFTAISKEAVVLRKKMNDINENGDRKNFLDTLIGMVKDQTEQITEKDGPAEVNDEEEEKNTPALVCDENFVAANIFMFFAAGYDSSAKICTYCLFELAANQNIQARARKEVTDVLQSYDDNLTLEAVQKMTYLEQIVAEVNRKYPILSVIFRKCDKRYTMPDGGVIEPGTPVIIPSSAIHFDPQYYPEPDKFDPERFSDENKRNIHPSTHLPFGMGPRICVAWQFAIIEIKVILARILSEYTISLHSSSQQYPLRLRPKSFLLTPESDIYLSFSKNN